MKEQGHDGNVMVSGYRPGFGSSDGGELEAVAGTTGKHFWHPGPHTVVLATPTAVRVIGVIPWIHHTRVKKAATSFDEDTWKTILDP